MRQLDAVEITNDTFGGAIFPEVLKKQSIISKNLKRYQFGIINSVKQQQIVDFYDVTNDTFGIIFGIIAFFFTCVNTIIIVLTDEGIISKKNKSKNYLLFRRCNNCRYLYKYYYDLYYLISK
jgi:hypothetical protein